MSDPARRRHVCRPSLQRPEIPSCFRLVVGPANVHGIELASAMSVDIPTIHDETHRWAARPSQLAGAFA